MLKRCKRAVAVLCILVPVTAGSAQSKGTWMTGDDITAAFTGKTIQGRYASGKEFSEDYLGDGRVEYQDAGGHIAGHWSVTAGSLCTIYDGDESGGCFRVAKSAKNCFEFYFISRTEEGAADEGLSPDWTAQGHIEGSDDRCPQAGEA